MPAGGRSAAVAAGCGALLTLASLLGSRSWQAWLWVATGLVAGFLMLQQTRRDRPSDPLPAWLLAAGGLLLFIGHAMSLMSMRSLLPGQEAHSPAYAALPLLLAFPVLSGAVTAFQRERIRHDRDSLLDALVVTVATAQAGWLVLFEPMVHDADHSLGTLGIAGGGMLGELLLLAVITRLGFALAGTHDGAARLLLAGLGVGLTGEVAADLTGHGAFASAWFVGLALVVLAVHRPEMAVPRAVAETRRLASPWHFLVLLGLACLVSPLLVVTHPAAPGSSQAVVMLGSAVLLFGLALLRIVSLLSRLRRTLRRENVLRSALGALVGAADRPGVRDAALGAAIELLDQPHSRSWRVDGDPGGTVAQATESSDLATFVDASELALFPAHEEGIRLLAGPSMLHATLGVPTASTLVLIGLPVRGPGREGAVIAVTNPPSSRTAAALQSLASTMHLALERLDVGEIMLERRSERRLRLMLQHASDVICILDHDLTIVHVTAAVEPIVGLPAPELLGLNWLDVVADDDRSAARDLVSLAQGGRPARGEIRLNSEDGHVRRVEAVVSEVVEEDLMGFVITCHDITSRHELEEQLTHQAFHDALTGLANRALFRDRLGHAMARGRRAGDYGVLFVDLDDFKTVNDSLGHAAGDELLKEMTTRLRTCLRPSDTAARLGGDEFAILVEDVDGDEHCSDMAACIIEALSEPATIAGAEITIGASIGIAVGRAGPATPEDIMRNADLALYDAKNAGKNRYAVYAPTMHEAALARLSLTSDLRHALDRDELVVHYQPLVDLASSRIIGLEALVRWVHPELGLLQPGHFITLAEETGLIVPLGRQVLQQALSDTVAWQRAHAEHSALHIAVNVSGRQLQEPTFVADVASIIAATGIDPATVVLEITESILLPGDGVIVERLHALAALGVHLYIDDFGTGYSSLSYLQMLPVHGLKLAQEFVGNLPGSANETGLVRTIRDLASTLGLSAVVAEGIERPEQWSSLLSMGYSVGQGYHLAVPMAAERIPTFLSGLIRPGNGDWERATELEADNAAADALTAAAAAAASAAASASASASAAAAAEIVSSAATDGAIFAADIDADEAADTRA